MRARTSKAGSPSSDAFRRQGSQQSPEQSRQIQHSPQHNPRSTDAYRLSTRPASTSTQRLWECAKEVRTRTPPTSDSDDDGGSGGGGGDGRPPAATKTTRSGPNREVLGGLITACSEVSAVLWLWLSLTAAVRRRRRHRRHLRALGVDTRAVVHCRLPVVVGGRCVGTALNAHGHPS